ncbi:MAG: DUF354 domain-containing protein [Candidatus Heimdallarchaeota archaeon]|nr:DUF354 domain-containing protein [Candidatus Heimdallarchaeota archaeon]
MVEKKIVWFDILTPKQAMLFIALGKRLQEFGFEAIYTTREHDYIHDIFHHYGIPFHSFGKYGGKSLERKLLASAKRVVKLSKFIIALPHQPALAISLSSPDATRVAYGLKIPIILFNDTSHSEPVARLTLSLARHLITLRCIDTQKFIAFGAQPERIHTYSGVDEIEYIFGENYQHFLKLRNKTSERYLVFRPEESYASYMINQSTELYLELLEEILTNYTGQVYVLPRYPQQKEAIKQQFGSRVFMPKKGIFFMDLLSKAELVITGGGTMAREAALLGIPSLTYFWRHLEPQVFLEEMGFPSFSTQTLEDTIKTIRKLCAKPSTYWKDTSKLFTKIQKPSDILLEVLRSDKQLKSLLS